MLARSLGLSLEKPGGQCVKAFATNSATHKSRDRLELKVQVVIPRH